MNPPLREEQPGPAQFRVIKRTICMMYDSHSVQVAGALPIMHSIEIDHIKRYMLFGIEFLSGIVCSESVQSSEQNLHVMRAFHDVYFRM